MKTNPLEKLLIEEKDIPAAKARHAKEIAAYHQRLGDKIDEGVTRGLRKLANKKKQHQVRRIFVRGAIIDVLGNGESTRIWCGPNAVSRPFFTMTQKEFLKMIQNFNEAMTP